MEPAAAVPVVDLWARAVLRIRSSSSLGSGFVIDAKRGLIWTCAHVLSEHHPDGVSTVDVGMEPVTGAATQWLYRAEVLWTSMAHHHPTDNLDGALLVIRALSSGAGALPSPLTHADGGALPSLSLGDDTALLRGESTLIILGYPGDLKRLVPTTGIFSSPKLATGFLLTTSIVLPGHSGGPAVNRRGEIVGWNVRQAVVSVGSGPGVVSWCVSFLRCHVSTHYILIAVVVLSQSNQRAPTGLPTGRALARRSRCACF